MRVTVRLFAGLRERAGCSRLELDDVARVDDVWPALDRVLEIGGDEPPGLLYAVNREYAERDRALADGDEVALIPPVSGGGFRLAVGPLDVAAVLREVEDPEAGAVASFVGSVRRRSRGRDV
ncbi:MAG: MoaD/ThiS family protein, partial [Gaiellaceae bacterium]